MFESIRQLLQTVWGVLTLQPIAYQTLLDHPDGLWKALLILSIGAFFFACGQSAVLFANRIPPNRFLLALFGNIFLIFLTVLLWAFTLRLVAFIFLPSSQPYRDLVTLVAVSFAPLWFGFFVLIPVIGIWLNRLIRFWVYLCIVVGISAVYHTTIGQALLAALIGAIIMELLERWPLFDEAHWQRWIFQKTTGQDQLYSPAEAANLITEHARHQQDQSTR